MSDLPLAARCWLSRPAGSVRGPAVTVRRQSLQMFLNKRHLIRFFIKDPARWYIKACLLYNEREIAVPTLESRNRFSEASSGSGVVCVGRLLCF